MIEVLNLSSKLLHRPPKKKTWALYNPSLLPVRFSFASDGILSLHAACLKRNDYAVGMCNVQLAEHAPHAEQSSMKTRMIRNAAKLREGSKCVVCVLHDWPVHAMADAKAGEEKTGSS